MTRSNTGNEPCPLCGRITRAHSRLVLADVERAGRARRSAYATVICRDCAVAMVIRSEAMSLTA